MTRLIADEQLQGEVIGLIHADPDSGFGVIEFAIQGEAGTEGGARCAGPLSDLVEGQTLRLVGAWRDHPRYGRTFEVTYYEQLVPTTESGLRSFLRSERFEEVSERGIAQVLSTFGPRAGWVIENEPDRLTL
jgi:exodeoxyribonuclease V alpha subunit